MSPSAQKKLFNKQILGQYKTVLLKRKLKEKQKNILKKEAFKIIRTIPRSRSFTKLCCALLWWCEGNKDNSMVRFTSSDETLIKNFLYLLRSGFKIDESKLRVLVHLHTYHIDIKQRKFWSEVTGIPLKQFHKSYQKANTGKRQHENYQGCIAVTYYDAKIAKELEALYNVFSTFRGVR
ncbi:hypothetical protein C4559_03825 [Candidatus Microgenomates bacterium]|nr:MAG: hypothetical protein C4559_03825 [Candidatus Microgenomates bacterium]